MLIGTFLSVFFVPVFYLIMRLIVRFIVCKIFKGKSEPIQGELDLIPDQEDMDIPQKY